MTTNRFQPPHPYLTREETEQQLLILDFDDNPERRNSPEQRKKMAALQKLIAGAIAEWADVEPGELTEEDATWSDVEAELREFTHRWLVR
jgi:hypothetical protein